MIQLTEQEVQSIIQVLGLLDAKTDFQVSNRLEAQMFLVNKLQKSKQENKDEKPN